MIYEQHLKCTFLRYHILQPYQNIVILFTEVLHFKLQNMVFEPTPPLFGAPVEVISLECRRDFWHKKTRVHGLSHDVVCLIHSE